MSIKYIIYSTLFIFLIYSFTSCSTKNTTSESEKEIVTDISTKKNRKKKKEEQNIHSQKSIKNLIKEHQEQEINFKTIEGKISATIQTGKNKLSSKANLRLIKNEALMLSVQPFLGIEMFRVIVTHEQIIYIDRTNQYYFQEDIEKLTGELKSVFNFYVLQSLFTNRLFLLSQKEINNKSARLFRTEKNNDNLILSEIRDFSTVTNQFIINDQLQIIQNYIGDTEKTTFLQWQYEQFKEWDKTFIFPQKMNLKAVYNKQQLGLNIQYNSLNFDKEFTISEDIPSRYKRISLKQLTKLISNIQ